MTTNITKLGREMVMLGTYDNYSIEEIIEVLRAADDLYYNEQQSFLEDNEYDALRKFAEALEPYNPYFTGVGSDVRGGKVKLPYQMGSLDQIDVGEITDWVGDWSLQNEQMLITDKLDGTSAMVIYDGNGDLQIAYSRGNGVEGADITRHVRKFASIPKNVGRKMVVRGEVILTKNDFTNLRPVVKSRSGELYKNARNMVAGLMNAEKNVPIVYETLRFVAYDVLGDNTRNKEGMLRELAVRGFDVPYCDTMAGQELTDNTLAQYLNKRREKTIYEIDGLVVDVVDASKRKKMNPTRETLNPAYAIKYKVADASNVATAKVKNVTYAASKHGYLKPRVEIEPTELVGVTVRFATGFNAKFIYDNMIGTGAVVQITRSGDVIPYIQKVVKPAKNWIEPSQDWEWNETGVDAVLLEDSDDVLVNRMTDFFSSIDAPYLKKGNVSALHEYGYDSVDQIINMSERMMMSILGENGRKAYKGLHDKLNGIPVWKLFGAHATARGIGVRKMKKLFQEYGMDLLDFDKMYSEPVALDAIDAVEGFDYKTALKVLNELPAFRSFMQSVSEHVTFAVEEEASDGLMKDQKIVFTGFRDKDLQAHVEAQGGTMQSAVSSKTTIVVASNPNSNSGKLKKARDLGVKVMGIDEFKEMLT